MRHMWRQANARLTCRSLLSIQSTSSSSCNKIALPLPSSFHHRSFITTAHRSLHSHSHKLASLTPSSSSSATSSASSSSSSSDLESAFADLFAETGASTPSPSCSTESAQFIGEVSGVNRGIISIDDLPTAHVGACVEFLDADSDVSATSSSPVIGVGLVLSMHAHAVKVVLLGSNEEIIGVGQRVRHRVGHVPALDVAAVPSYRGQVIDALGRILDPSTLRPLIDALPKPILVHSEQTDDDQAPQTAHFPLLSTPPAPLSHRSTAHAFLPTGVVHVDAFHPIAQGLRIGLFGAKRSGKTALATALMGSFERQVAHAEAAESGNTSSLLSSPIPCPFHLIYVSIGQSRGEVQQLIAALNQNGAMKNTTLVVASSDEGMGMQYLAPFMGVTLSDYYRNALHESSFVVFDDLSAHGHLLTSINRFYGYPILAPNFVHAQLLERIAPLDVSAGGASSTALVLVETNRADRSLDINENLSGFVDHAIWLDANLAAKGVFPAINIASVLGRPSARYRPHMLRSLTSSLSSQLLQSERKSNTSRWAGEFGFEAEEEDIPLLEFKDKCQLLLSQSHANVLMSLTDQLVLLYAMQKDATMLASISFDQIRSYGDALIKALKQPDRIALYEELDSQVRSTSANAANSTQQGEESSVLSLETVSAQHDSATPLETITSKPAANDQASLWKRLDQFIDEFNSKFTFGR